MIVVADSGPLHYLILLEQSIFFDASTARFWCLTLEEAAARLAAAGVAATPGHALGSLKRCQPARAPIYRDGDHYALDPHDDEVSFWLFRLGLRPPRVAPLKVVRSAPDSLPSPDHQLTVAS